MKDKIINLLRKSEQFTKTDMTYVVKGSFWWLTGKAGLFLISFATMIAFARWLDPIHYGTYQFVIAGLAILSIFSLPGINTALIKSIAQKKEGTLRLALKEKIRWGTIGSFISLCLAIWYFLQGNELLAVAFLLGTFFIPFKETFHIFAAFWNGRKKFDQQAKYKVLSALFSALLVIPTIYLTYIYLTDNVLTVLIILTVFLISHTFFDWVFYYRTQQQIINSEQDEEAVTFGKHLTLMNIIQITATHLDKIIIWHFLGAVPVAVYAFAKQPIERIRTLIPITPLALPKLGENQIDEKRKKGVISKFLRMFVISIPAAAALILLAPFLYQLFFPQYAETETNSVPYFQALSVIVALSPFLLVNAALIAEMKKKALYIVNTGAPLLKIILFLALIPQFGLWGIVAAILTAELLRGLLGLYFFLKI